MAPVIIPPVEHAAHDYLLQDLALILLVAGVTTVVFRVLRQPVVLGYLLAGIIIGPHTFPFPLVQDEHVIETLAQLGVILLMFSLGLHFSVRQLARVGGTVSIAAIFDIGGMALLGFGLGQLFGWSTMDSIFLAAIISISSTTIIVKALEDLRQLKAPFAQVTFGILIIEDIAAIVLLAVLSGIGITGGLSVGELLDTLTLLAEFLAVVLLAGLIFVPPLLRWLAKFKSNEMMLVAILGLCFGVSLLALLLGFSVALGAFLIGAVIAESREGPRAAELVEPVRDMFSAVFFVAIGMMIQPAMLIDYAGPIAAITVAVIVGKLVCASVGAFIGGSHPRTALRAGMSLTQIGEFSFIIAALGQSLGVTSSFLYPTAITVSAITTLTTPYLMRASDPLATWLGRHTPHGVRELARLYSSSKPLATVSGGPNPIVRKMLRRSLLQIALNLLLIGGLFIAAAALERESIGWMPELPAWTGGARTLFWSIALFGALPLCVAVIRKVQAVSMIAAELSIGDSFDPARRYRLRAMLSSVLTILFSVGFAISLLIMGAAVLPPLPVLVILLLLIGFITSWLWGHFVRVYARAQVALHETFAEGEQTAARALPAVLRDAEVFAIEVRPHSAAAGKLIRELEIRTRTGASVVAIERGQTPIMNPSPHEELQPGDRLFLLGSHEQMLAVEALLAGK